MKFLNKKSRLVLEVASLPHRRADILHQRNQLASWVEDPSSPDSSCPRVRKNERKRKKEINSSFCIQFLKVVLIYFIPTKWQQWDFFYIATLLQQHTSFSSCIWKEFTRAENMLKFEQLPLPPKQNRQIPLSTQYTKYTWPTDIFYPLNIKSKIHTTQVETKWVILTIFQ